MRKYLDINSDLCMGCCACEIACKMEHVLEAGTRYIVMHQTEDTSPGKEKLVFTFAVCRQCQSPACLDACPNGAIYRSSDGIVLVDQKFCSSCGQCKKACPWSIPQIKAQNPMKKCNLCYERQRAGLSPACIQACPAKAIHIKTSI